MNLFNPIELSTTSESDSEYLVDSRCRRTTIKYKRKALKKIIKLIHGRCVVIYRGSRDLLPIAAKDADRNCYCDFVFICYEPKPNKLNKDPSIIPRSRSALHESSTSENDDNDDDVDADDTENMNNNQLRQANRNRKLEKRYSFSLKTNLNNHKTKNDRSTEPINSDTQTSSI